MREFYKRKDINDFDKLKKEITTFGLLRKVHRAIERKLSFDSRDIKESDFIERKDERLTYEDKFLKFHQEVLKRELGEKEFLLANHFLETYKEMLVREIEYATGLEIKYIRKGKSK